MHAIAYSARILLFANLDLHPPSRYVGAMGGKTKKETASERAERLAKALRENLHRRKSQARQRKADSTSAPKTQEPQAKT